MKDLRPVFVSLSSTDFKSRFNDEESCLKYLRDLKWAHGFQCVKCGHTKYCSGVKPHDRQCTSCRYIESPTANTIFHRIKFPLEKAFGLVHFISKEKKNITSTELSRKLDLRQKTCWLFKQKVVWAMESSKGRYYKDDLHIDDIVVVNNQEQGLAWSNEMRWRNKSKMVLGYVS